MKMICYQKSFEITLKFHFFFGVQKYATVYFKFRKKFIAYFWTPKFAF